MVYDLMPIRTSEPMWSQSRLQGGCWYGERDYPRKSSGRVSAPQRGTGQRVGGWGRRCCHCWESPRAFSVKSKYNLALSIHPGARIASAGILAIQIKCYDLNAFLPDSVEARGEAGIEGIEFTPGRDARDICSASEQRWRTIFATFSSTTSEPNGLVLQPGGGQAVSMTR